LPADFARQLATRVVASPEQRAAFGTHLEFALVLVLATVLAVAAGAVVAIYGNAWLPSFTTVLPTPDAPTIHWLLALAGCLGASWLLGRLQAPRTTATPSS
jgi:hypothetical protein